MILLGRRYGKQAIINAIVDDAVLEGQHVHTHGPEGMKCYGGRCEEIRR